MENRFEDIILNAITCSKSVWVSLDCHGTIGICECNVILYFNTSKLCIILTLVPCMKTVMLVYCMLAISKAEWLYVTYTNYCKNTYYSKVCRVYYYDWISTWWLNRTMKSIKNLTIVSIILMPWLDTSKLFIAP